MKDFPKTKQFVDDLNFLGKIIFDKNFFADGFFYDRAKSIFKKYSDWDERELTREFIENTEVQSIEGLQNAFDVWKTILNGIDVPDCDLFNYHIKYKDYGERADEGREMLEMIQDTCGVVRREVQYIIEDRNLKNRCTKKNFLSPPYYELGDIGFVWADSPNTSTQSNAVVVYDDIDFTKMHKFSPKKGLPLKKLLKFLINEKVISDDVPEEYFINCILHAYLKGLREQANNKMKIQRTFDYIGSHYFPKKETDEDGVVWDYRVIAAREILNRKGKTNDKRRFR